MAAPEPAPVNEAADARVDAATAIAVAAEASAQEAAAQVENAAVARAEQRAEDIEQAAEDVALAALHTELGRQVSACQSEFTTWRASHDQIHETLIQEMGSLKTRLDEMTASIQEALNRLPPLSILPASATTVTTANPAVEAVTVAEPATVGPASGAADGPVVATSRKKIRFV